MRYLFLITIFSYLIFLLIVNKYYLHMLQQNRYNRGLRYCKWLKKKFRNIFLNYNLIFLLFLFFPSKLSNLLPVIFLIIYFLITIISLNSKRQSKYKLPLKYTARLKRLIVTNLVLNIIPCLLFFIFFKENNLKIYYFIIGFLYYVNPLILLFANYLNQPVEYLISLHFKNKALKRLKNLPNMKTIGITGSYGKTTTKNIVYEILSTKYNVFKTPENYNTPYGLMLSINEYLEKFNDFFIAEMGACKNKDIKKLCDLVKPQYGILTTIGLAHLETFKSIENITKTKFELIESLPQNGIAILNGDDEKQLNYPIKNKCSIYFIGINNQNVDCYATNIKLSYRGTSFEVVFKKEKRSYKFTTKLLGNNNIYNILSGLMLGKILNIPINQMQFAVKNLKPTLHRLSLSKYYDINIIDDAYNSNPLGAQMALEVLNMMPGKHIIVTPGMIEMGSLESKINFAFGQNIAKYVDEVILIGKEKTRDIYKGLISAHFPEENIYILNNVMDSFPLIKKLKSKETYVLLENDLPDTFNEEE